MGARRNQSEDIGRDRHQKRPARHRAKFNIAFGQPTCNPRSCRNTNGGKEKQKRTRFNVEFDVVHTVTNEVDLKEGGDHREKASPEHRHQQVLVFSHPRKGSPHLAREKEIGVQPRIHRMQREHTVRGQNPCYGNQHAGKLGNSIGEILPRPGLG